MRIFALLILSLPVFSFDLASFLEGYRAGYNDASVKVSQECKLLKNSKEDTEFLKKLLEGKGKRYISVFKTKCGKDYFLFVPLSEKDFSGLLKGIIEQKTLSFVPGYYVYVDTTSIPVEVAGVLKYLAKTQLGLSPFFKGRLLVFAVVPSEAGAIELTKKLNKTFARVLKNPPRVVYTYLSTSSDNAYLLMNAENF